MNLGWWCLLPAAAGGAHLFPAAAGDARLSAVLGKPHVRYMPATLARLATPPLLALSLTSNGDCPTLASRSRGMPVLCDPSPQSGGLGTQVKNGVTSGVEMLMLVTLVGAPTWWLSWKLSELTTSVKENRVRLDKLDVRFDKVDVHLANQDLSIALGFFAVIALIAFSALMSWYAIGQLIKAAVPSMPVPPARPEGQGHQ